MSLSKLPPQALEVEEAVIGSLLLEKDAYNKISDKLRSEMFYNPSHATIYDAICSLHAKSSHVDLLTVASELQMKGKLERVGGAFGLTELTNRVASSAHIQTHSLIIYQKFIQRELIRISTETVTKAYDHSADPFRLIQEQQEASYNLIKDTLGRSSFKFSELIPERLREYQKKSVNSLTGISSGIKSLDTLTGGWQKSNLVIIGGRPAMGKTAFVLNIICQAALVENRPVGMFSIEMKKEELVDRVISSQLRISGQKIKNKELDTVDFRNIQMECSKQTYDNITIDDTPEPNIQQLRAKAIRMLQTDKIEMLIIDYIGLMKPDQRGKQNRTNEIGEISRSLKSLAKELNIPVLVLSQLNRAVEDRPDKKPRLSDLRDSGDIEQDADIVMFLYRPEYYNIMQDNQGSTENKCYLMIEKHRAGQLGCIPCLVDFDIMKFEDYNIF